MSWVREAETKCWGEVTLVVVVFYIILEVDERANIYDMALATHQ